MKPIILALDTASSACSASLYISENAFYTRFELTQREHTRLILPMIGSLLLEAGLKLTEVDLIAVGRGPGSFTGVRIAVSVAQGLGFALSKPIYPISTLEALAYQAIEEMDTTQLLTILPAIDARMQEVYAASYQWHNNSLKILHNEFICAPQALCGLCQGAENAIAIGSGWDTYENLKPFEVQLIRQRMPDAKQIAFIAKERWNQGVQGEKPETLLPVYLRDKVAEKSLDRI